MTFSIAARCAETGMFGIAVSSSSPAVAARCAFARARVGAVTTQNITDPSLGPRALELMRLGATAKQAIEVLERSAPHIDYRQLTAIDVSGGTAAFSGAHTLGTHTSAQSANVVCAGNLLASLAVPEAMAASFAGTDGPLGDRLLEAMRAALDAGGEAGPVHSAGMLLVRDVAWPVADLRVDWHDDPIGELVRLWQIYAPQLEDYVQRALNPGAAPAYGVLGEK